MNILEQLSELDKPTVQKKPWMSDMEFFLGTLENLEQIEQECIEAKLYGLDLETTGLDQRAFPTDTGKLETVDKIVGFCLSPSPTRTYYIPVRHRDKGAHANVPPRLVVAMIQRIQASGAVAVFHNAKFDHKFLQYEPSGQCGEWDDPKVWEDTLLLAYLRDPREKAIGLKVLSKKELGREMIQLEELFPSEMVKAKKLNFATLDPTWEPVLWYAGSDALNTLALYRIFHPVVVDKDQFGKSQKTIYTIEKICVTATIWMEQCRIHINKTKLIELIQLGQAEWWDALNLVYSDVSLALDRDIRPNWVKEMAEVFDPTVLEPAFSEVRDKAIANAAPDMTEPVSKSVPSMLDPKVRETVRFPHKYDVTIPAQLGLMLRELGVQGLTATEKSGQIKTSKEVLDEVIEEAGDQFPFMGKVKRFREVSKSLGGMLFNIYWDMQDVVTPDGHVVEKRSPDNCVWANFNGTKVDTGRFSSPTPEEDVFHGQVHWNVQATTSTVLDKKKPKPECARRQRECVSARPGHLLFAIDYSGVELRIVTNLSGEQKWLTEFFRCSSCEHEFDRASTPPPFCPECGSDKIGDIHTLTALSIYGAPVDKPKRTVGKVVNFLLCYGGSGSAVQRSTGVDKEEGWRIKNQFDKAYTGLLRWWKETRDIAKKQNYVTTVFGRKYPVPDINLPFADPQTGRKNGFYISKAERNAVNGPVQGSSADIMKLAMGLIYRECKKRGWLDKVLMTITIHDELVFEIHESVVAEAIPVIEHIMCVETVKNLNWAVPLKVDIEFGDSWMVPKNLTEMTWNHGDSGKHWTPYLAQCFPDRYANYLKCGGKSLDGVEDPPQGSSPPVESGPATPPPSASPIGVAPPIAAPATPIAAPATPVAVSTEKDGPSFVYRLATRDLVPDNAKKLAQVIKKCIGKGVDTLHIRDSEGNDLVGGPVRLAYTEFKILIEYELGRI